MLHNVVLASAEQQPPSVIVIYTGAPLLGLLPLSHPTPPGRHRAPAWAPCVMEQLPSTCFLLHMTVYNVSDASSISPTSLLPLLSPQVCFLCLPLPFLPCKQVHQHSFSRFHIYALLYLFFSDFCNRL